jgi:glycine cleavage system H protein
MSVEEFSGFRFRPDLYYNEHVWAKVEADGNMRVGFDDIVAKGAVKIFMVKLLPVGTTVTQKKKLGILESIKYTGPIVAPVSGTIVSVNDEVRKRGANAFKDDPYGTGWLSVVKPSNLEAELKNLLYGEAAADWFKKEAEKSKDDIAGGEYKGL